MFLFSGGVLMPERFPEHLPRNLSKYKGSNHFAINYEAANFIVHSEISQQLNESLAPYRLQEESFFKVLNFNPELNFPGGMRERPESNLYEHTYFHRHKNWPFKDVKKCPSGKIQRNICMIGVNTLPILAQQHGKCLAINKFPWEFQPMAWDCMIAWHVDRVRKELETKTSAVNFHRFLTSSYVQYARTVPGY